MKKFNTLFLSTLGLGLLASQVAQAQQSIGNGATPARTGTMLDVNGPLATAETAVAATGTTAPTATIATATGQVQLTTGTATAGPITVSYSAATNPGQRLVIYNSTALAATFNSQDIPAGQAVEFVYSNSGWRASAGGGNSVAATNGLTKTGNAIGLGGTLTRPTTVDGVSATNPLNVSGTAGATFTNTTGPVTLNVTNRVLALRGGYNGGVTPGTGGTHLSFLEGGNNEVGRVASVQENGPFNIGLGFHTAINNGVSSGALTERLRISAAGNVGIGTTTPTSRLHLLTTGGSGGADDDVTFQTYTGTGAFASTLFFNHARGTAAAPANLAAGDMLYTQVGSGYINGGFQPSTFFNSFYTGDGTTNLSNMQFGTSGAERLRIAEGGNVGIGITTPSQRLDVEGGGLRVGNPGTSPISTQGAYLQWNRSGGFGETWLLNQKGTGPGGIRFGATDAVTTGSNTITEWARFDANGNLGIGTTTPGAKLDVNGNARIATLATGAGADQLVTAGADGTLNQRPVAAVLATGGAATTASNGLTKTGSDIALGGALTAAATTISGLDATHTLSITGTTAATFANTTAGVNPNVTNRVLALLGGYNGGVIPSIGGAHLSFLEGGNNEVSRVASVQENGPFNIGLGFHTANGTAGTVTERLRISAAGNVGIGTTTPTSRLHLLTTGGSGGADDDVTFQTYTGTGAFASTLFFNHARGTAAAPANLAAGDMLYTQVGSGYINGGFQPSTFFNSFYTGDGTTNLSNMQFGTSGAERLRIAEGGNVGIGTMAPNTRLSITPNATEAKITLYDGGSTTTHFGFGISNGQLNYDVPLGQNHVFFVNSKNGSGSEVLRLNANGAFIQTPGGPQLGISTSNGAVASVPANANGNVYYEVAGGAENHVFGGNVVTDIDNSRSLGLSASRWAVVYATNGTIQTSDSRLKTHIENSGYGLKDVLKMRPVTYNWKSEPTTNHMVGFIAQEMEQIVPEAVVAPKAAGEYYGMKYEELIPVLTKAIQEQQAQIEALKTVNAKLQVQASGADAKVSKLEASLLTLAEQVKQLQAGGATATTK